MGLKILGAPSAAEANVGATSKGLYMEPVDPLGNILAGLHGTKPAALYGLPINTMNDGVRRALRGDRFGSVAISKHTPRFVDSFGGTTINPIKWLVTATTMAATQADASGLTLNSGNVNTATIGYLLTSTQRFLRTMRAPLHAKIRARPNWQGANAVMRLGIMDATTFNGSPTSGVFFEIDGAGAIMAQVFFNGSVVGTFTFSPTFNALLNGANFYVWDILLDDDSATFIIQDTTTEALVAETTIRLGATAPRLFATSALPLQVQQFHSALTSGISNLIVSNAYVAQLDQDPFSPDIFSQLHLEASTQPFTGVQNANNTNSAAPANATLSNTAAGYTTLGGRFGFVAVAGAATDYCLFGFQVPAGRNLRIRRVVIDAINTGAAVATTPSTLDWFLSSQQTAVSLATAGAVRQGVGIQSFPVGAVIGAIANRIDTKFDTPIVCSSGRFIVLGLRMPVASATASQVVQGQATLVGEFY